MSTIDNLDLKEGVGVMWVQRFLRANAANVLLTTVSHIRTDTFAHEVDIGNGEVPQVLKPHPMDTFDGDHVAVSWNDPHLFSFTGHADAPMEAVSWVPSLALCHQFSVSAKEDYDLFCTSIHWFNDDLECVSSRKWGNSLLILLVPIQDTPDVGMVGNRVLAPSWHAVCCIV